MKYVIRITKIDSLFIIELYIRLLNIIHLCYFIFVRNSNCSWKGKSMNSNSLKRDNALFVLMINAVISIIFYRAHYWTLQTPFFVKMRTYVVIFILLLIVPVIVYFHSKKVHYYKVILNKLSELISFIKSNTQKILRLFFLYFLGIASAYPLSRICAFVISKVIPKYGYNIIMFYCFMIGILVLITCWKFRKIAYKKIHLLFLILSLFEGLFFCLMVPVEVGISWDDEIHYQHTTNMVDYFNGVGFKADDILYDRYQYVATRYLGYDNNERIEHNQEVNISYLNRELGSYAEDYGFASFGYVPHAIGLLVGRGLGLAYSSTFIMGRLFSMLFYIGICTAAIKNIISGKILMTFIALFPTTMYMAGSYSYDPWITALSLLGFSYFFNILQKEKANFKEILLMLFCFIFAFGVKPEYFPALFFLLFVPKNKFENKKEHIFYIIAVILTATCIASIRLLPIILGPSGLGTGDLRGGGDVNSSGQVEYILADPIRYIKLLLNFLKGYTSPLNAGQYIQNYAYMSLHIQAPFMKITEIVFVILVLLDFNPSRIKTKTIFFSGIFGIFCATALVATALYVSFTPVGCETIYGCQYRYLTPIVFPFTYLLNIKNTKISINRNILTICSTLLLVTTFMIWTGGVLYVTFFHSF